MNEEYPNKIELFNAIPISSDNPVIERDLSKCIDCGLCKIRCQEKEGMINICDGNYCVYCGQCIQVCPTGALKSKINNSILEEVLNTKTCIAYISPAVRVAIGDLFGFERGAFVEKKLITALKKLGFSYVFDVSTGADLTVIEESAEFVKRFKNNINLPLISSCCPSWVKYCQTFYPEITNYLSTCKSPIGMTASIVENYILNKLNIKKEDSFMVAITPCTSKKYEIMLDSMPGTDMVITTKEISEILGKKGIDLKQQEDSEFDRLFSEYSLSGLKFGVTGGVSEAIIRTIYYILEGKDYSSNEMNCNLNSLEGFKEFEINISDAKINVAIVNGVSNIQKIIEEIKSGNCKYHLIEVMNCEGGCIGGGGQPKPGIGNEKTIRKKRVDSLKDYSNLKTCVSSYKNSEIQHIYAEFLNKPLSEKSLELLHNEKNIFFDIEK